MASQSQNPEPDRRPDPETTPDRDDERPDTWRTRHGLKVGGILMIILFAVVVIVQVRC